MVFAQLAVATEVLNWHPTTEKAGLSRCGNQERKRPVRVSFETKNRPYEINGLRVPKVSPITDKAARRGSTHYNRSAGCAEYAGRISTKTRKISAVPSGHLMCSDLLTDPCGC